MGGTTAGTIFALCYYLFYQTGGILFALSFLRTEKLYLKILAGSVMGSFSLHWLPTVASMIMGFNRLSHIVAAALFVLLIGALLYVNRLYSAGKTVTDRHFSLKTFVKQHAILFLIIPTFIYFVVLLLGHTFPVGENGGMYTGQCTYGDMNLHLAIITSIANQGTFPPHYSLLPDTRLSYPFLSDSISSSLYIWNASLRVAYIFPMLFAILQVFFGFYLLAKELLGSQAKAVLAWTFFFFNGGLGFFYFLDIPGGNTDNFTRIFSAFYETPTNYPDGNIKWVNTIVDMLLPQRATLFGWALFFPLLLLLVKALKQKEKKIFLLCGILAGGMPMIHTHSFLALAMICMVWLVYHLLLSDKPEGLDKVPYTEHLLLGAGIILLFVLQYINMFVSEVQINLLFALGLIVIGCVALLCVYYLVRSFRTDTGRKIIINWLCILIPVLLLALPQLFIWTFHQAEGDGFIRGHLNWSNASDLYIWFYLKNIGVVLFLALAALFSGNRKTYLLGAPAMFIWLVAELIAFQPNDYDNNKLLFAAYALLCFLAADFLYHTYCAMKKTPWKYLSMALLLLACTLSALLTMGREYVSNRQYELYNANQVELASYIEENTPTDATILMDTRHNNAVAALAGRNLVCGSSTFLYFHGLDYLPREEAVHTMYTDSLDNRELFLKYGVDYVVVGPEERASYPDMDESAIASFTEVVFNSGDVTLYRVIK